MDNIDRAIINGLQGGPPIWNYNLFAMVHGRTREEAKAKVAQITELLGEHVCGQDLLYSTRILKKTGLRLAKASS